MPLSNLQRRVLTAFFLGPLVLYAAVVGAWPLIIFLMLCGGLMAWEWSRLTSCNLGPMISVVGVLYIVLLMLSLWMLHNRWPPLFALFLLIWAIDTLAYVFGRLLKGPKLWPAISPNKTWTGFIGGVAGAFVVATVFGHPEYPIPLLILFSITATLTAQAGDLFISAIKRKVGVKDTGHLLPGHGGVLDRMDGFLFLTPAILLLSVFLT